MAAIDFVIALEDRERSTPTCALALYTDYLWQWKLQSGDQEPVQYPSSTVVSDEKAAEWGWSGDSKDYDFRVMNQVEKRVRTMFADYWGKGLG